MEEYAIRNELLREMGYQSYKEYLQTALWQSIRARVLCENQTCQMCNKETSTIVHHLKYDKATLSGKSIKRLRALCEICHHIIEFDGDRKNSLKQANEAYLRIAKEPIKASRRERPREGWESIGRCKCGNILKVGRAECRACRRKNRPADVIAAENARKAAALRYERAVEKIKAFSAPKKRVSKMAIERERLYLATGSYE